MPTYGISFADHRIRITHDADQVETFLDFLFADLSGDTGEDADVELSIEKHGDSDTFAISSKRDRLFEGSLGVKAAAILYDVVIFHLLDHNRSGVALHCGAVSRRGQCILLPGVSGAGKSSVAAYLTANGFSYATDELVFFYTPTMLDFVPFTRPICLKVPSAQVFTGRNIAPSKSWLMDEHGAIIPHRSLNSGFNSHRQTPELLLFPFYKKNAVTSIGKLSGAQASTRLVTCCANARNLNGHGFREIASLARLRPAYQLTYGSFSGLERTVTQILDTLVSAGPDS